MIRTMSVSNFASLTHPQRVRYLYKLILRLHRALPPDMAELGNRYVREEFRKHKNSPPAFIRSFMVEWSDASTVIELTASSLSPRFRLRTSGDAETTAAGYAGVSIVLSEQVEASLLDWIPVDSRLYAVRLATSARESRGSEVRRTPFILSAYALTDCSFELAKDSFYDALGAPLQQAESSDIFVVVGNMNAQRYAIELSKQVRNLPRSDSKECVYLGKVLDESQLKYFNEAQLEQLLELAKEIHSPAKPSEAAP
ncbi:hypothetical protein T265_03006 [Opisthorchis viverrini]|uniref:Succinate dehydrogenase assembly factor 3 n=1 Tax=Opisthorchis viverrini TaxID=6198 RepID=A0A075AHX8_OPIVI|nr:hypothetical protein T265_03006 [Opisthorchis viverrini]KER30659.1 hypothetical protein T265_03006 [Opisthorchis viverrini]